MSQDENLQQTRRGYEALNRGDVEAAATVFAPTFRYNGQPMTPPEWIQQMTAMRRAFPDIHFTIEHMMADGEWVAQRTTIEGTFQQGFMGVPPTSTHLRTTLVEMGRFEGGKLVEAWSTTNLLRLLYEAGALVPARMVGGQATAGASS